MSGELVKTAPADRSSVKPLQSVSVSCRSRMGCRMMPPLAACPLLRHVPPSSCLLAALSSVSSCRLVLSPRRSCRASVLCSPAHLILRLVASFRRAYSSSMFVSSHPLVLSVLAMLAYSLRLPPRFSCRREGRPRVSLSSRHASRLPPLRACLPSCVPLVLVVRLRMSSPCLPLWCGCECPRLVPASRSSCRWTGRCRVI